MTIQNNIPKDERARFHPVIQTDFGNTGNCLSACIASLLGLPISDVPNFFHVAPERATNEEWWNAVRDFLRPLGYGIITFACDEKVLQTVEGYLIVSGKSTRDLEHSTIWYNGKMIHDPHPDKCGIIEPVHVDMIYPLMPWQATQGQAMQLEYVVETILSALHETWNGSHPEWKEEQREKCKNALAAAGYIRVEG